MYNDFFGFRERPFKLVPNPAYLYLSRSHEEALAHLTYAVNHGEGFVAITGEVGTGKTTLCRMFLENLPPEAEAAYIFNPRLDELQLLQAINAEFGIDARSDSVKALVDRLNAFLMAKKGDGKQVLLLIDEAQNLTRGVLEQLRLLSNLETIRDKLLQIILVGQPELDDMLRSPHLRQLSQRITISSRLYPLNRREVGAYIRHRIGVAAYGAGVPFARSAVSAIFKYSGGIPRLINVACDRALLVAFGSDQREITGRIAHIALRELAVPGAVRRLFRRAGRSVFPLTALGCAVLGVLLFYGGGIEGLDARRPLPPPPSVHKVPDENPHTINPPASLPPPLPVAAVPPPESAVAAPAAPLPGEDDLAAFLEQLDPKASRRSALRAVLGLWEIEGIIPPAVGQVEDDPPFFQLAIQHHGLQVHHTRGERDVLRKLGLPAVIACSLPGDPLPRYLALVNLVDGRISLSAGEDRPPMAIRPETLNLFWSGTAHIPWKNFYAYPGVIPVNSPPEIILTLKMHLRALGFKHLAITPDYDAQTREAIETVQARHGLVVDGYVGTLTKIALYNESKLLKIPRLFP